MTDADSRIEPWRSVAAGWERRAGVFRDATVQLTERLVTLLDPTPGETILELAAGLGETGFEAARRLGPEGRLLTTDAAPEMVAAAERRAEELGIDGVEPLVLDLMAIDLPDGSVDGVLCRFAVMLVDDPGVAVARDRAGAATRRSGGARSLGVAGRERLDDGNRPVRARARAHGAPRSAGRPGRSGSPTSGHCDSSSPTQGSRSRRSRTCPCDGSPSRSTSGGRRPATCRRRWRRSWRIWRRRRQTRSVAGPSGDSQATFRLTARWSYPGWLVPLSPADRADQRQGGMARAGLEPATPRFSAVCSTN